MGSYTKTLIVIFFASCLFCQSKEYEFFFHTFSSKTPLEFTVHIEPNSGNVRVAKIDFYFEISSLVNHEKMFPIALAGNFQKVHKNEPIWYVINYKNKLNLWIINKSHNCAFKTIINKINVDNIKNLVKSVSDIQVSYKYEKLDVVYRHNLVSGNDFTFPFHKDFLNYVKMIRPKEISIINGETHIVKNSGYVEFKFELRQLALNIGAKFLEK